MSRGGRGGGGGGRMKDLPFEIDTALEDQINAYREKEIEDGDESFYPPMTIHNPAPPTAQEKRRLAHYRSHREAMRSGPFFMNTAVIGKRDAAEFNAFEDVPTYNNKRAKNYGGLPNLKKVPIVKELLPKELWDVVSDGEEGGDATEAPKKNLAFLKKKRLDKLAQFDEGADIQPSRDIEDDIDEVNEDEDGEEAPDILEDDEFSEDDDDAGNDYNAEKYFDDGDGIDDDGDDGGGGEDAW